MKSWARMLKYANSTEPSQLAYTLVKVFRIIHEFKIFEADFLQKVSLKMLNKEAYNSFSDLFIIAFLIYFQSV